MRPDLLEKARGIADRLPLNMNKHNVARLRAVFAYDLAIEFEKVFQEGVKAGERKMTPPILRRNGS